MLYETMESCLANLYLGTTKYMLIKIIHGLWMFMRNVKFIILVIPCNILVTYLYFIQELLLNIL